MKFEFFRYFSVSLVALIADFIVFSFGIRVIGIPWFFSATAGFIFGVSVAYYLSIRYVFSKRKMRASPSLEFVIFLTVGISGLLVTQLTLWIGIEELRWKPELAKLIAAGFTFVFNFLIRKIALFNSVQ